MCQRAAQEVGSMAAALSPEIKVILTILHEPPTVVTEVMNSYDTFAADLSAWTPGNTGTEVVQAATDLDNVFNTLPFTTPEEQLIAGAVLGAIASIVGIVQHNSPPPPAGTVVAAKFATEDAVHDTVTTYAPLFQTRNMRGLAKQQKDYFRKVVNIAIASGDTKWEPALAAAK